MIEVLANVLRRQLFVIPTKVGIQFFQRIAKVLDSRLHGNDDFQIILTRVVVLDNG